MPEVIPDAEKWRLQQILNKATGPAPWYWKSFPDLVGETGKRYEWSYHGETGALAYLVTLNERGKVDSPLLALNTYCTPFLLAEGKLGVWCPDGRSMLRIAVFDPDRLKVFQWDEIVGWFKNSGEKMYSTVEPMVDWELSAEMAEGTHEIDVPQQLRDVEELLMIAARRAMSKDVPACTFFVLYPHAGLVQVLPQAWFNQNDFEVGKQWITRLVRDPVSHRIIGDGFRIDGFRLSEDGKKLESWLS